MKKWFSLFSAVLIFIVGCSPLIQADPIDPAPIKDQEQNESYAPAPSGDPEEIQYLENLGKAPELANTVWINSDTPLRLKDLHGKVVLLDMWTFGCYNCRNTIPSLKEWHEKYAGDGLVIIANHYPEFSYEANLDNLKQAVKDLDIRYAVAQDNDGNTWRAYNNRYWPTLYLIDKNGDIRYTHIGEGQYTETERAIQTLLAESTQKE